MRQSNFPAPNMVDDDGGDIDEGQGKPRHQDANPHKEAKPENAKTKDDERGHHREEKHGKEHLSHPLSKKSKKHTVP